MTVRLILYNLGDNIHVLYVDDIFFMCICESLREIKSKIKIKQTSYIVSDPTELVGWSRFYV